MTNAMDREAVPEPLNPLGFDGIEFIEFATSKPQALGGVLEMMGFRPIARHRSREVELYRQGTMNIIVNAQPADVPRTVQPVERPILSAFAVRVRDAECRVPPRARSRRLGDSGSRGTRWSSTSRRFTASARVSSISSTATTSSRSTTSTSARFPPSTAILRRSAACDFFGIVQYVGAGRTPDWVEFYSRIFGFTPLPNRVRFGIMPKGMLLQSPCKQFFLQLIEPDEAATDVPLGGAPAAHRSRHARRAGSGGGTGKARGSSSSPPARSTRASAARSRGPISAA